MKFFLPFPPSVNTYWRSPNKGAAKGKHLVSAAGRKFKHAVRSAVIEQLRAIPKPSTVPAGVEIILCPVISKGANETGVQARSSH